MILDKWNPIAKQYFPHEIPDNWHVTIYTKNMSEIVNCANCGKEVEFGSCFPSRFIHNKIGLGYPVCSVCFSEECEEEDKADEIFYSYEEMEKTE